MKHLTLGIIGGTGKMGAFFHKVFAPYVQKILISSLDTELTNRELVERSDVVLLSVPIRDFAGVVEELLPHFRKEQLLLDLTSLKEMPCQAMLRAPSSVIGMHPLFGPTVGTISGQTIAICPVRAGNWEERLFPILETQGAKLFTIDPKTHDENMALIQSLTHFTALLFSDVVRKQKSLSELLPFATPVFKMFAMLNARVLSQSPQLYSDMQMENPFVPQLLESFSQSLENLENIVLKKDKNAFVDFFTLCETHFSSIKEKGQKLTQKWVEDIKG
jgi:prephenate dehydrogenase